MKEKKNARAILAHMQRPLVLRYAFGIPFERIVRYHRAAGALAWVAVTVHMALWCVAVEVAFDWSRIEIYA